MGFRKSYYVKTKLKSFLEDKKNGKYKCVIVSLYGLSDTSEISKAIYTELRTIKKSPSTEAGSTAKAVGKIVGKTVFNGLVSKIGFDIGKISEEDYIKIYESVDLSEKLIVFEDIERTKINIIELLGYINNMCENDGVKVLLVTNESELLTTKDITNDEGLIEKHYTDSALAYIRIKEKTIEDTLRFECDHIKTIRSIIEMFNNDILNIFTTDEYIMEVLCIMSLRDDYNLRTFIFACQKTVNIINMIENPEIDFCKNIFFSIVSLSISVMNDDKLIWNGDDYLSFDLGINRYPLYKFCYDYVVLQLPFDNEAIERTMSAHKEYITYDQRRTEPDSDIVILYRFEIHTEKEIIDALSRIERRLDTQDDILFSNYYQLAFCLVLCHSVLDYNYNNCKQKMINNIIGRGIKIFNDTPLYSVDYIDEKNKRLFNDFIKELSDAAYKKPCDFFPYEPQSIKSFYDQLINNKDKYIIDNSFIFNLDKNETINMLLDCKSYQLFYFRRILNTIYTNANSLMFSDKERKSIIKFKELLETEIKKLDDSTDRIIRFQFNNLLNDLQEYIDKLS